MHELIEADSDGLETLIDVTGLELAASGSDKSSDKSDSDTAGKLALTEAIITPNSRLVGRSARVLDLRERYGVNVLAVARLRLPAGKTHCRLPGSASRTPSARRAGSITRY